MVRLTFDRCDSTTSLLNQHRRQSTAQKVPFVMVVSNLLESAGQRRKAAGNYLADFISDCNRDFLRAALFG